ncbi:Tetratricopeptide repeat-containing protein [Streptomyces sp. AmelKG-E11A]|nr:Tetratricopeptide repeat-containing protein [Streptomyces sp. AmelKG-E11A]
MSGTGEAVAAASDSTAVTGYRGPAPRTGQVPGVPVSVSRTGDATATHGAIAVTGNLHVDTLNVVQRGPQEPASWPHQVGVIPLRARSFQHRGAVDQLAARVDGGGTAVLSQVLTGMGGVGKTQLAADYARTAWEYGGLDVLVWVTASTREAVVAAYAQAGVELCRADPGDPERAARSFLAWLTPKAGARPCRWLIVLDDVTDPADLRGLWPPAGGHGRTLITTRRRDAALAGDGRRLIQVGVFSKREALTYLTTSLAAHGRTESTDQLELLVCELGHLPLALAQAAAYLIDSGDTVATYRELLADRTTTLTDTAPDALPDDQALPLAAAWSLSVDRADTLRPAGLARPMLQLAAMLDANGIPHDVLTSPPVLAHLATPDTTGQGGPVSARDAVHALRALHRLSLLDHTPETPHQAVRVHQLIQRATRDTLTAERFDRIARTAGDALIAAWPAVERDTALAQNLRANAIALASCAEDALHRPDVHPVQFRTGDSYGSTGQLALARDHYWYLAETTRRHLGPYHAGTLAARSNFAFWRGRAGDAAGAVDAFAELLADQVRVFGPVHRDTLAIQGNLARMRGEAGDAAGAAEAFADLLKHMVRVHGEDHPDTLTTRSHLARMRGEAGDAAGAAEAFADLLVDRVRVLGEDHRDTLTTRSNLAAWRGRAGDAVGAADALVALLADRVRVLGEDHPETLVAGGSLAAWRGRAGDAAGAVEALTALLKRMVSVLGEDHPDTLTTRNNLAVMRGKTGDVAGAVADFAALLADRVRIFGEDHPDTLITRGNLAGMRGLAGDATGAAQALTDLLDHMTRVLSKDHPHLRTVQVGLAHWRGQAERSKRAR